MNNLTPATDLPINAILAKTGLFLSGPTLMICVFLLGFFLLDSKAYSKALMLLLFTLVYNLFLKSIWQIPLKPPLEGWAFPSGHMHAAWVFWGWLAWHYKSGITSLLFVVVMLLSGYGLLYHDFHDLKDILGSVGFGSLTIFLFHWLNRIPLFKGNIFVINVLVGCFALLFLFMIPMPAQAKSFIWIASGALMGMAMGWLVLMPYKESLKPHHNLIIGLVCVIGMIGIHVSFSHLFPNIAPQNFYFAKTFILMLWVMSSKRLLNPICIRIGAFVQR